MPGPLIEADWGDERKNLLPAKQGHSLRMPQSLSTSRTSYRPMAHLFTGMALGN
jgi:hypothetical protein